MKRLTFLVNQGENNCFMIHGLDWATYLEGSDWQELTQTVRASVDQTFRDESHPAYLDFKFPDGSIISLSA